MKIHYTLLSKYRDVNISDIKIIPYINLAIVTNRSAQVAVNYGWVTVSGALFFITCDKLMIRRNRKVLTNLCHLLFDMENIETLMYVFIEMSKSSTNYNDWCIQMQLYYNKGMPVIIFTVSGKREKKYNNFVTSKHIKTTPTAIKYNFYPGFALGKTQGNYTMYESHLVVKLTKSITYNYVNFRRR
jgi:hypothetical protein